METPAGPGEICDSFCFVLNHYDVQFAHSKNHRLFLCSNGNLIATVDCTGNVFVRDLYTGEVVKLSDEPTSSRTRFVSPSLQSLGQGM